MFSLVSIQVFSIMQSWGGCANTCIWLTIPHEARKGLHRLDGKEWHIPNKSLFARLAAGFLEYNAWIQIKSIYWWCFWRQWCGDVASGADRHLDITFGMQVVESSSPVSALFREALGHSYTAIFHLLVNGFCVIEVFRLIICKGIIGIPKSEYL